MERAEALQKRQHALAVVDAYEAYLRKEVVSGTSRVKAVEALVARPVSNSIAMSVVSQNQAFLIANGQQGVRPQAVFGEREQELVTSREEVRSTLGEEGFFRDDLTDCIPCSFDTNWEGLNWDKLKAIFEADLQRRLRWLDDINLVLFGDGGNPILDEICRLIRAFAPMCPQDLVALISLMTASLMRNLEAFNFNFSSAIRDIIGQLLRPYVANLQAFISTFLSSLTSRFACIANLLETSADLLQNASVVTSVTVKNVKDEPGKPVTYSSGNPVLDEDGNPVYEPQRRTGAMKWDVRHRDFFDKKSAEYQYIGNVESAFGEAEKALKDPHGYGLRQLPVDPVKFVRDQMDSAMDWVEGKLIILEDTVMEFLHTDWLNTSSSLSLVANLKNIAQIIDLLEVIREVAGGNLIEKCTDEIVLLIIEGLDARSPDTIEEAPDLGGRATQSGQRVAPWSDGAEDAVAPQEEQRTSAVNTVSVNLGGCLSPSAKNVDLLSQWMRELDAAND